MANQTDTKSMFEIEQHIVYPAHGVGRVTAIEVQEVADMKLEVYVVAFEQDKLILRVPTAKAESSGMRSLASTKVVGDAIKTLGVVHASSAQCGLAARKNMKQKINSGDLISIAEVVRDLHRAEDQPDQSYSERQLYESALDRMARELAVVENIEHGEAVARLSESLAQRAA